MGIATIKDTATIILNTGTRTATIASGFWGGAAAGGFTGLLAGLAGGLFF